MKYVFQNEIAIQITFLGQTLAALKINNQFTKMNDEWKKLQHLTQQKAKQLTLKY